METKKIVNLLNSSENEYSKFATQKWYVIDSESKSSYLHEDSIKFVTKSIESSLCDCSDACIFATRDIAVKKTNTADTGDNSLGAITQVVFKKCTSFKDCKTEINNTFVDFADFIPLPMYNLIKYSDNYSNTSGS